MIKAVQLVRGDTVEVMAEHRLITISVLDDGTININTPKASTIPSETVPLSRVPSWWEY